MPSAIGTAHVCSYARARHVQSDIPRIFDDYLAAPLLGVSQDGAVELQPCEGLCHLCPGTLEDGRWLASHLSPVLLSRAAFAEQALSRFAHAHERCQYVICGAGLDTFAFRNCDARISVFEVDLPAMQGFKRSRIADLGWVAQGDVHFVTCDFDHERIDEALAKTTFDPRLPTFVSILGVTYYLHPCAFERTLASLAEVVQGPLGVVFDYPDADVAADEPRMVALADLAGTLGEVMVGGYSPKLVEELLATAGYEVADHLGSAMIQERFLTTGSNSLTAYEAIRFVEAARA